MGGWRVTGGVGRWGDKVESVTREYGRRRVGRGVGELWVVRTMDGERGGGRGPARTGGAGEVVEGG